MSLRLACLAVAVTLITGACTAGGGEEMFIAPQGPIVDGDRVGFDRVTVRTSTNVLAVSFLGGLPGDILADPCAEDYRVEVDESTDPLTIAVDELRPTVEARPIIDEDKAGSVLAYACTAVGHFWQLEHQLAQAPGSHVIDASTGRTIEVLETTPRLQPDVLPTGWMVALSDAPPEPPRTEAETVRPSNGEATIFVRSTLHQDPLEQLYSIRTEGDFTETTVRDGQYAELSQFNGRNQLRFVNGSFLYQLSVEDMIDNSVLREIVDAMSPES